MDDNYVNPMPVVSLMKIIDDIDSHTVDGAYYFSLYCDRLASDAPMLFVTYKHSVGWFLSIHEVTSDKKTENFLVRHDDDESILIEVNAGSYRLAIPRGLFSPLKDARECIRYFSVSGTRNPALRWVAYNDLGYELYTEPE